VEEDWDAEGELDVRTPVIGGPLEERIGSRGVEVELGEHRLLMPITDAQLAEEEMTPELKEVVDALLAREWVNQWDGEELDIAPK